MSTIAAIAKKEYVENVRNLWILLMGIAFLVFTFFASFGSNILGLVTGRLELGSLEETLVSMDFWTGFLVPILALMLAHSTFAGEQEAGSLGLLVAQPATRSEILLGKFAGLYAVLLTPLLAGIGGGGIAIGIAEGSGAEWLTFAKYLIATSLWAGAFIALGILISTLTKRRTAAVGLSLLAWFFFTVVYKGIIVAVGTSYAAQHMPELAMGRDAADQADRLFALISPIVYPLLFLSPSETYNAFLVTLPADFNIFVAGPAKFPPAWVPEGAAPAMAIAGIVAWIALPLWGAKARFERKDL